MKQRTVNDTSLMFEAIELFHRLRDRVLMTRSKRVGRVAEKARRRMHRRIRKFAAPIVRAQDDQILDAEILE